jgi:hypothetical protein
METSGKIYNAVPPPGVRGEGDSLGDEPHATSGEMLQLAGDDSAGELLGAALQASGVDASGFSLRKGLRRVGRGIKKAGRVAVKVHTAPFKFAAKYGAKALKALAMTAARPIRGMFRKLGMRRARWLAMSRRRSNTPNGAELAEASRWTVAKMNRNPMGKFGVFILKHTHGHSVSGASIAGAINEALSGEDAALGITGAEIAAAAASILAVIKALMSSLNKPGEAPENAAQALQAVQAAQSPAANPTDAPAQAPAEQPTEAPTASGDMRAAQAGYAYARFMEAAAKKGQHKRWITLDEAKKAANLIRERKGWNKRKAEAHVLLKCAQKSVGIVPDAHALPATEVAERAKLVPAGAAIRLAGLLGAVNGKKAYRNRTAAPMKVTASPVQKSADDMIRDAERFGGYASQKERAKARKRDAVVMLGELLGGDDASGESIAGESLLGESIAGFPLANIRRMMVARRLRRFGTRRGIDHFGATPARRKKAWERF